jgi:hypothetical protein
MSESRANGTWAVSEMCETCDVTKKVGAYLHRIQRMYGDELRRMCNEASGLSTGVGAGVASPKAFAGADTRLSSPANV